jgi:hypothetical protein
MLASPKRDRGPARRVVRASLVAVALVAFVSGLGQRLRAQVSVTVNANNVVAQMPDNGIGLHTSVYANIFGHSQLPGEIAASGVDLLRYPGGNYASIYHWTNHTATGGYAASQSHFGNFVDRLMDDSGASAMVTVNYGSNHSATIGGQPEEAAAWVAYANGDPNDTRKIGFDEAGKDWKTVGYWATLRSLTPAENPDNQYDFLAINHDAPLGIKYWEIGNEINGNGYYSDIDPGWNWQYDLHAPNPYGPGRGNHPALSPTAYGNNFNAFAAEMKFVDPTIKVGAVLAGPGGVGDVSDPNRNWDRNVLLTAGQNIDFGIYHYYPGGGANNTNTVLNSTDDLPGIFDTLRNRIDTYVGPGESNNIELHMTEFKYFGSVDNPQIDGIYAANTYATALADGIKSVHWLELSDSSFVGDNQNNQGLIRGGAFYGIQVFSRIAEPGSEFVQTTSTSGNLEVHSTVLPDGRIGMLLANLNASGTATANVIINGFALDTAGSKWLYGQNQTTPLETPMATGLGNSFSMSVPFRSIVALLIDSTLQGDFNRDGTVDAADYVVWRKNPGGVYTQADFNLWRAHFGHTADSGSSSNTSVPEPGSAILLILVAASGSCTRRRIVSRAINSLTREMLHQSTVLQRL